MIPKIIQIVSFLLYATPNHFISLNLLLPGSRSHYPFLSLISTASALEVLWSHRHVDTKLGVVQGFIVYPNGFNGVEVFLNLPYASSPEGNLRFMPPVSGSPWSGVRRSDRPSAVCPQPTPDIRNETEALKRMPRGKLKLLQRLIPLLRNQSEDCLYLNLYVPMKVAEGQGLEKLAVLVFIHGDDYGYGAGHPYDPTMLVSLGNIIVVTLNYRLGILGFLNAHSDSHFRLPYNFALLDQIAALQWVQENIALFGGDRTNVTLMGHGKGATLVNFLMISSAVPTGLLFHRVILSSGSALSPLSSDLSKGPELSKRFAKRVRCPPEPSSTMLECLREVPVRHFLESELWSLFGPSGDGIVVKNELPPDNVIMNRVSHYPLLFGVVKAEILPELSNHDATYGMESERRRELLKQFITKYYRFHRNEILAGAIHEYTDWEKPAQHPLNVREETLEALADAEIVAPLTKVGDLHSQSSRSRAYFYVFDYQSKFSDYQQRLGCVHAEDLLYVFGVPLYFYENDSTQTDMMRSDISGVENAEDTNTRAKEKGHRPFPMQHEQQQELGIFTGNYTWYEVQLSLTVMRLWANFVRVGNPNGDPKSQVKGEQFLQPLGKVEGDRVREAGTGGSHTTASAGSTDGNRLGRENLHKQQQEQQMPEPIFVEWPLYDSLDKKYLVLDLRPRIKERYRAHKLSFWLHLVPDYQRNDEGTSITGIHHGINNKSHSHHSSSSTINNSGNGHGSTPSPYSPRTSQNLSKASVIPNPTVFASGLYDLSSGSGAVRQPHNSSASSNSPKLSPVFPEAIDPDLKEQQDSGNREIPNTDEEESMFGFQTYSTALSVTIAIGCSLLVLNILIFATFYYEREKRLNALRRSTSRPQPKNQSFTCSGPQQSSSTTPNSSSLKRRKENGGVGGASSVGTSSFYNIDRIGTENRCNESRISSAFGDLHLSTYVSVDEEPCGSTGESATVGEVSYVNYPIKRYSERPVVGTILRSGSTSGNRQRRAINELPMPIDMSLTNDPNFLPQSSPYRALEIGTTFVGIEASTYCEDHFHQNHRPHYRHHQQQPHEEDNSSIDDGQSSH